MRPSAVNTACATGASVRTPAKRDDVRPAANADRVSSPGKIAAAASSNRTAPAGSVPRTAAACATSWRAVVASCWSRVVRHSTVVTPAATSVITSSAARTLVARRRPRRSRAFGGQEERLGGRTQRDPAREDRGGRPAQPSPRRAGVPAARGDRRPDVLQRGGELVTRPQRTAGVGPRGRGRVDLLARRQHGPHARDRLPQRIPRGEELLVGHRDVDDAVVSSLRGEQVPVDERVAPHHQVGQGGHVDPAARRLAVDVDRDELQQCAQHLVATPPGVAPRLRQRRIGLPAQRAAHAADGGVPLRRELAAPADAVGELGQGEGQQREGLAVAGVVDEARDQLLAHRDPGAPRGLLDHLAQRSRPSARTGTGRRPPGAGLPRSCRCTPSGASRAPAPGRRRPTAALRRNSRAPHTAPRTGRPQPGGVEPTARRRRRGCGLSPRCPPGRARRGWRPRQRLARPRGTRGRARGPAHPPDRRAGRTRERSASSGRTPAWARGPPARATTCRTPTGR